jgi:hypothetical protein
MDACDMPREPEQYALILGANVGAARSRLRLRQASLAARMAALGWNWHPQTVSEVEAGRRALRADEILGLTLALETSVMALMSPPFDAPAVATPSGDLVGAARFAAIDGSVEWDGDTPKIIAPSGSTPVLDAMMAGKREELRRMEEYIDDLRRDAGIEPQGEEESAGEAPDVGVEDIPPRRLKGSR